MARRRSTTSRSGTATSRASARSFAASTNGAAGDHRTAFWSWQPVRPGLLTDDAFDAHLDRVHAALADGGLYVLELPHPADLDGTKVGKKSKTRSTWSARDAAGVLDVSWLDEETADGRIIQARVRMEYRPFDGAPPTIVEDQARHRRFGRADVEALVAGNGRFGIDGVYGALDEAVPLDGESAWRMVVILEKRAITAR